ncbi:MAG: hypothetical protein V5B40_22025 [Candidatus Accumulibacter meliphilus]|jgi:hypothetical protein|uniref:tetratricopeptide repeat protein n=1 Tax=Candidatus Accumulibacter meliphilus TaxID=2211374 RepID=UPI002FC2E466
MLPNVVRLARRHYPDAFIRVSADPPAWLVKEFHLESVPALIYLWGRWHAAAVASGSLFQRFMQSAALLYRLIHYRNKGCMKMFKYLRLSPCSPAISLSRVAVILILLAVSTSGVAAVGNHTEAEVAMLPPYCRLVFNNGRGTENSPSPAARPWLAVMGNMLWHIHHYCYGQIIWMRAMRHNTPSHTRRNLLNSAISEYDYVIKHSPDNFILLPEILTQSGDLALLLSDAAKANELFARARALKPDYWPAYSHWADYLIRSGKRSDAKQLVSLGLKYSPHAKVLREQDRLLGGNPSNILAAPDPGEREGASDAATVPPIKEQETASESAANRSSAASAAQ